MSTSKRPSMASLILVIQIIQLQMVPEYPSKVHEHHHHSNNTPSYADDSAAKISDSSTPNYENGNSMYDDAGANDGVYAAQAQGFDDTKEVEHPQ